MKTKPWIEPAISTGRVPSPATYFRSIPMIIRVQVIDSAIATSRYMPFGVVKGLAPPASASEGRAGVSLSVVMVLDSGWSTRARGSRDHVHRQSA